MPGPVRNLYQAHYFLRGPCHFSFPWATGIPNCSGLHGQAMGKQPLMGPAQRLRGREELLFIPWRMTTAFYVLLEPSASAPAPPKAHPCLKPARNRGKASIPKASTGPAAWLTPHTPHSRCLRAWCPYRLTSTTSSSPRAQSLLHPQWLVR